MSRIITMSFCIPLILLLFPGCRSPTCVVVAYPTDIAYELVKATEIRSWNFMEPNEAAPIVARVKKMYVDNDAWPEDIKRAEAQNTVKAIVFESRKYYAVYWLYSEEYGHRKWYYFLGTCFNKNNFNEALFSGGGNYNLDYDE